MNTLAALLLACAQAASAAGLVIGSDLRVELVGVVQRLAGRGGNTRVPAAYAKAVDERFGRLRGHRAVALYRAMLERGPDAAGVEVLFLTDPPELVPRDATRPPPFEEAWGGRAGLDEFLAALRAFAAESDFAGFYREHEGLYREWTARVESGRPVADPLGVVSDYMGETLPIRHSYLLGFLYDPGLNNNFIIPYPGSVPETATRPVPLYEVYSFQTPLGLDAGGPVFRKDPEWQEPAYVYVERNLLPLKKAPGDPAVLYGPITSECARSRERWFDCAAALIVEAVEMRLDQRFLRRGAESWPAFGRRRLLLAMVDRLKEYEADRKTYPKLSGFYPRLLDVLKRR